jgi:glycosyltransferase involved in cell wall biosynthesis
VERLTLGPHVRFLGLVPVDDLVALYNQAQALAFPSLYEGFGLPVVEAMACGVPVLTSRCGSLAEVAGDAAQFVDPLDVQSIAEGLWCVVSDQQRQEDLRARGLIQASRFSWLQTAAKTVEVYRQVLRT